MEKTNDFYRNIHLTFLTNRYKTTPIISNGDNKILFDIEKSFSNNEIDYLKIIDFSERFFDLIVKCGEKFEYYNFPIEKYYRFFEDFIKNDYNFKPMVIPSLDVDGYEIIIYEINEKYISLQLNPGNFGIIFNSNIEYEMILETYNLNLIK